LTGQTEDQVPCIC